MGLITCVMFILESSISPAICTPMALRLSICFWIQLSQMWSTHFRRTKDPACRALLSAQICQNLIQNLFRIHPSSKLSIKIFCKPTF